MKACGGCLLLLIVALCRSLLGCQNLSTMVVKFFLGACYWMWSPPDCPASNFQLPLWFRVDPFYLNLTLTKLTTPLSVTDFQPTCNKLAENISSQWLKFKVIWSSVCNNTWNNINFSKMSFTLHLIEQTVFLVNVLPKLPQYKTCLSLSNNGPTPACSMNIKMLLYYFFSVFQIPWSKFFKCYNL